MAINKITSKSIKDVDISADDLAPGTITNAKLADDTIENAKLANKNITINGTAINLGASGEIVAGTDWQTVKTGDFTAVAGEGYFVDTTSVAISMTLPTSASQGDTVSVKDYAGTFGSNALTINRNGHNLQGNANNATIGTNRASIVLVYIDATKGWLYTNESNVQDLATGTFVSATGGTVLTNGDFKTHVFTGDGCFVVSSVGNPNGGPSIVDYLVVAGGGSGTPGTSGGGGAGGFRVFSSAPGCNSPLNSPAGLTVSVQTYPISVGGGGANPNNNGSNSVFSTVTSAGGGRQKADGGSGGGGMGNDVEGPTATYSPGGSGNTPPVSPPQGNDGGDGNRSPNSPINRHGGGGGGAGAVGDRGEASPGTGVGGIGSFIADPFIGPTAPSYGEGGPVSNTRYFAGGGGGGLDSRGASGPGAGGVGGGGDGGDPGGNGTANTGGGAGGTAGPGGTGGAGGKGIVMIRYKFQ